MSNKMKLGFNFIELGMNKIKPILNFDMAVPCRQFAATSRGGLQLALRSSASSAVGDRRKQSCRQNNDCS